MSCLPKPVLRGHIKRYGIKSIIGAVTFATVNVCLLKFFVIVPRVQRREEFKKSFDSKALSKDLIEWGYFQTIRAEDLKKDEE